MYLDTLIFKYFYCILKCWIFSSTAQKRLKFFLAKMNNSSKPSEMESYLAYCILFSSQKNVTSVLVSNMWTKMDCIKITGAEGPSFIH